MPASPLKKLRRLRRRSYSDDYAYTDESYETYDDGSDEVSTDEGTEDYTEYYTDGE